MRGSAPRPETSKRAASGPPRRSPVPSHRPWRLPLRDRERILASLEGVYREAFESAGKRDDKDAMARLDFEFQRDQLWLEALLDVRDLLAPAPEKDGSAGEQVGSLLEKARAIKRFTGR